MTPRLFYETCFLHLSSSSFSSSSTSTIDRPSHHRTRTPTFFLFSPFILSLASRSPTIRLHPHVPNSNNTTASLPLLASIFRVLITLVSLQSATYSVTVGSAAFIIYTPALHPRTVEPSSSSYSRKLHIVYPHFPSYNYTSSN